MDRTLRIELLGAGILSRGGSELRPRSTKTLALLAYLAVEHARPHARSRLAALLWPADAASAGRQSLRQSQHALRALGDGVLADRLAIDGELVRFVPGPGAAVDVHRFEDDIASASIELESRALQALAARSMADGDTAAALDALRQAIDVDRAINDAHALGHDLVQLAWIHLRRHERAEARAALQEALVWFDYVADVQAHSAVLAACAELDAGRDPTSRSLPGERVPSHLPLAEGKVYCMFESPLARAV